MDSICLDKIGTLKTLETEEGSKFAVTYHESKNLPKSLLDWAFDLLERNMRTMYEGCDWGWNPKEKLKELTARKAKFLFVFKDDQIETGLPFAFVHFRVVKDYGRNVIYCYELQLESTIRGHRIGSWLMKILEHLALILNHPRVVLTVLKSNQAAINFYRKVGYDLDETSPAKSEGRPYFIYSKAVVSAP